MGKNTDEKKKSHLAILIDLSVEKISPTNHPFLKQHTTFCSKRSRNESLGSQTFQLFMIPDTRVLPVSNVNGLGYAVRGTK